MKINFGESAKNSAENGYEPVAKAGEFAAYFASKTDGSINEPEPQLEKKFEF